MAGNIDYKKIVDDIANITPNTRIKALEKITELENQKNDNEEAYKKYREALYFLPAFVKSLKKNLKGKEMIQELSKKTKSTKLAKELTNKSKSLYSQLADIVEQRHEFNSAVTQAGVKLHSKKLAKDKNIDWGKIYDKIQAGTIGEKLRKEIETLSGQTKAELQESGSNSNDPASDNK